MFKVMGKKIIAILRSLTRPVNVKVQISPIVLRLAKAPPRMKKVNDYLT